MKGMIKIMQFLGLNEIREKYLSFFENKQHLRLNSFPLIPHNDKSLLLINSGMAPLKPYFTGMQTPPKKRVTTCQKCIRTGDIENVGKTARHGTFFEMLGNFSFGDYFKREAIPWAWEFFTKVLEIPEERLYVSVYKDDDEAFDIWNKEVKIPAEKIFKMGKEDNFWEHGTGPCGPCSEIYYDKGEKYGCNSPNCTVGCDCDRYMEIWNLVFTQFDAKEDGTYDELKQKNIDTGMGLERIAAVMQNVDSIFDVDTVKAIRDEVCRISGKQYNSDYKTDVSIRVITDHIRSVTFMTADGILPSNEGRGYVLRRLLRRAARHGRLLGIKDRFLSELCGVVIANSKDAYPELEEKKDYIYKILTVEEERFYQTLDQGMEILQSKIKSLKENKGSNMLNGKDSFKLYDTYGFPFELMKEILDDEGLIMDEEEFHKEMERQKQRARNARETTDYTGGQAANIFNLFPVDMKSEFLGYDNLVIDSKLLSMIRNDKIVQSAETGDTVYAVFDKTVFYAEMGGQTGDKGYFSAGTAKGEITDCIKYGGNKFVHTLIVKEGKINVNDTIKLEVDKYKRMATCRNHTTTHLLQKALRDVLGSHVEQAGSFVSPSRLRFDFTHFEAVSHEDLKKIESIVNEKIFDSINVNIEEMPIEDAKKKGATALFGEKYSSVVRVVSIGDYSIELCGGTHLENTSQAGCFKILSESGVAAGVRRIEALTGRNVINFYDEGEYVINEIGALLKAGSKNIISKLKSVIDENKKLSKELESIKSKMSSSKANDIINHSIEINGVKAISALVDGTDMNGLRSMCDDIKEKIGNGVVMLASVSDGKVNFAAMATDDAVKKGINCGLIVKAAASAAGGGGGGRPAMAQAGGKNPEKAEYAVNAALDIMKQQLS